MAYYWDESIGEKKKDLALIWEMYEYEQPKPVLALDKTSGRLYTIELEKVGEDTISHQPVYKIKVKELTKETEKSTQLLTH